VRSSRVDSIGLRALPWFAFAVACWPLFAGGFPKGHDWSFELVRIAEYQAALAAGQLPPYWGENLYGGYGSPVFLFYAPLFSAAASLLGWVLDSAAHGAALLLVLLTAVSVWTSQRMLGSAAAGEATGAAGGEGLTRAAARVGVYLYVLHPYLLGDKLLRNADAEFAALCLVPLVLEGVLVAGSRPRAGFALLSGGLALSVLSHNLTALVAMGLAIGGAGVLHGSARSRRRWLVVGAGIAFGLALAAFFWVPAVWLAPLVRTEELLTGKFDFHRQFPDPAAIFGYRHFYATGLVTPAVLLVAAFATFRTRAGRRRRLLVAALSAAAGLLFLLLRASTPVWEKVPLLPFFQFPWRMIGPLALVTSLAGALAFAGLLAGRGPRWRIWGELAVLVVCLLNALPVLDQYRPISPQFRARLPGLLAPESVRGGEQSATVRDDYLPRTANPEAWKTQRPVNGPVVSTSGPAEVAVLRDAGSRIELRVRAAEPARLRLARWAFPGWELELDGRTAELLNSPDGSLEVQVPAGETRVELRCAPPLVRRVGLVASGAALAVWIALLAGWPRRLWAAAAP
jgi:hypothetical protein